MVSLIPLQSGCLLGIRPQYSFISNSYFKGPWIGLMRQDSKSIARALDISWTSSRCLISVIILWAMWQLLQYSEYILRQGQNLLSLEEIMMVSGSQFSLILSSYQRSLSDRRRMAQMLAKTILSCQGVRIAFYFMGVFILWMMMLRSRTQLVQVWIHSLMTLSLQDLFLASRFWILILQNLAKRLRRTMCQILRGWVEEKGVLLQGEWLILYIYYSISGDQNCYAELDIGGYKARVGRRGFEQGNGLLGRRRGIGVGVG